MTDFKVDQIDHVEMYVEDRHEAAAWYERVFGLTILPEYEDWSAHPKGPLMISSDGGSTKLALFAGPPQGDREVAGIRLVAFRVSGENFMRFMDRLDELSLKDHHGRNVTRKLATDHGRAFSIYFNDPWGHQFEITTYDGDMVREKLA